MVGVYGYNKIWKDTYDIRGLVGQNLCRTVSRDNVETIRVNATFSKLLFDNIASSVLLSADTTESVEKNS